MLSKMHFPQHRNVNEMSTKNQQNAGNNRLWKFIRIMQSMNNTLKEIFFSTKQSVSTI